MDFPGLLSRYKKSVKIWLHPLKSAFQQWSLNRYKSAFYSDSLNRKITG